MSFTMYDVRQQDKYSKTYWDRMSPERKIEVTKSATLEIAELKYKTYDSSYRYACIREFRNEVEKVGDAK